MLDLSGATSGQMAGDRMSDGETSVSHDSVLLTLVPNSSIQFLDLSVSAAVAAQTRRRFFEEVAEDGEPSLNMGESSDDGLYNPSNHTPHDPRRVYALDGIRAIAPFVGRWLPIPFMRVSQRDELDGITLDEGPSNWTRVFIASEPEAEGETRFHIVVAIDTAIEASPAGAARTYAAPTLDDMRSGAAFRFSDDVDDIAWFVSEAWVDDWIREAFDATRAAETSANDGPGALQHLATYLTLLAVLKEACDLPALRFMEPNAVGAYAETVAVDLAVDMGTCRTAAFLEERQTTTKQTVASEIRRAPAPLVIRDLSRPWLARRGVFSSRLTFARANFGNEALSRWSGRIGAFNWSLPTRIGEEAERLARETASPEACFGISSPMNYLWDDAPNKHVWRFADAAASEASNRNPIVSGSVLSHLTEAGEIIDTRTTKIATTKPRFSRSSLVTLAAAELILHAAREINAPSWRNSLGRKHVARRLDRIVVTPPAGLTDTELSILRRRYEAAVKLVWQTMGWAGEAHPLAPPPPTIKLVADTATSAQFAYVENEIGFKLRGRADNLLALTGRPRSGFSGARVLRIATLDIGASTSSLAVATYELSPGNGLSVSHQLREGFEIGCDAVVREFAERFIASALSNRLADCKHPEPGKLIECLLGPDERNRPQWVGDLGRRLVSELMMPAAVALLQLYANSETDAGDALSEPTVGALLGSVGANAKHVADRLDVIAADEGADGFAPLEVPVPFLIRDLALSAGRVLKPLLDSVVQALAALDSDVVLLTGAGSRLPIVSEAITAGMPLRPDRIVLFSRHRMHQWFPSRANGSADQLAPVIGALVQSRGAFSSGGPEIVLKASDRASAGLFIGKIGPDGRIAADDVLFEIPPASGRSASRSGAPQQARTIATTLPLVIGMRTTSASSWPARSTWVIERSSNASGRGPKLPLKIAIELQPGDRVKPIDLKLVSVVDRDGGRLDPGEVELRLKCSRFAEGHWLDTGHLLAQTTGAGA